MNELHILDAGRADCIVCLFEEQAKTKTAVIDGGVFEYNGRHVLIDFLHEHKIAKIDLLILTHLHQDHYGGLCLLDEGVEIENIVTPCFDLQFNETVLSAHQREDYWIEYHRAFSYFTKGNVNMMSSLEAAGKVFKFGDCELQCIFPFSNSKLISVETIKKIAVPDLTESEMEVLFQRFKKYCNGDSSIWTLRRGEREIALFAGDSTEEAMRIALNKYHFHPEVLKLSHHGINLNYFSPEQISMINAEYVVVTNSKELEDKILPECSSLGAKKIHYTWNGEFYYTF